MSRIITLTTDFGLEDEYVGVMKGVILARAPAAVIVDLSHAIEKHNIRQAALLLASAYKFFPENTIHLVVVDPGVGSSRKLILLQAAKQFFLGPDNGVFGQFLEDELFQAVYEVQCAQYYLDPVSSTFHGRDILAPVAAQLAAGLDPAAAGAVIPLQALKKLESATAKFDRSRSTIEGTITGKDHFGNLQTNIEAGSLNKLCGHEKSTIRIRLRGQIILGIQKAYGDKDRGETLAIIGSRGFLEIAVNQGSAAKRLDAGIGDTVIVDIQKT